MLRPPLRRTVIFAILLIVITTITYSNHFGNSFHFDDSHTIENNAFIRDIGNIPLFFRDGSTFSSLPQNQSYRPLVSASLAIDYHLGGGYDLFYFHLSSFILFLFQGILMFLLFYAIMQKVLPSAMNFYIAAAGTLFYMLHPANAETINYIIARSDLQSTVFVVLALVMYILSPFCRKYFLYLLPVVIGALAKPPSIMFAPILLCYIWLFEMDRPLTDVFKKEGWQKLPKVILVSLPAFAICAVLYLFIDKMTPATWQSGGTSRIDYLITQPYVIFHYFTTFFYPASLSADTDWTLLPGITDSRFIIGVAFIAALLTFAFWLSKDRRLRPASFGILWFFLALVPSSSVIPFAEVLNDHRIFFPYIGLALTCCWLIGLLLQKLAAEYFNTQRFYVAAALVFLALQTCYAYGTRQRNKVWRTEESLWEDVTIKSPRNGRGLMNYGLAKMGKGDYTTAEIYFKKALELWPGYSFIYVNLGVLKSATGDAAAAENYFRQGVNIGANYPDSWYFYGRFLAEQKRNTEAEQHLKQAITLSPAHAGARSLLMKLYYESGENGKLKDLAASTLQLMPGNAEAQEYMQLAGTGKSKLELLEAETAANPDIASLTNLSLEYYNTAQYDKCISVCTKILQLDPHSAAAYNNIGSCYLSQGKTDESIRAFTKALEFDPEMQLAKNNLIAALKIKEGRDAKAGASPEELLNQSLAAYQQGDYKKCISLCEAAIRLRPDYADAYSNICASYNQLGEFNKAIEACNKALAINPDHKLAKGNLDWAKSGKK